MSIWSKLRDLVTGRIGHGAEARVRDAVSDIPGVEPRKTPTWEEYGNYTKPREPEPFTPKKLEQLPQDLRTDPRFQDVMDRAQQLKSRPDSTAGHNLAWDLRDLYHDYEDYIDVDFWKWFNEWYSAQ